MNCSCGGVGYGQHLTSCSVVMAERLSFTPKEGRCSWFRDVFDGITGQHIGNERCGSYTEHDSISEHLQHLDRYVYPGDPRLGGAS